MVDLRDLNDERLKILIQNYEERNATGSRFYVEALSEWNRRKGGALEFGRTLAMVREAARAERYLSYGEIAEAQGLDWSKVRYPMNEHLWSLVKYAHSHGWPMLSAIIVNKDHRDTGDMEPSTLAGFVAAARQLGYEVVDAEGFLRDQQRRCFEWGRAERLEPSRGAT